MTDAPATDRPAKDAALAKKPPAKKAAAKKPPAHTDPAITPAQLQLIGILMSEAGLGDRKEALAYVSGIVGHDVASRADLTKAEAQDLINVLRDLDPPRPPNVYQAIAAVKRDLPAVGKYGRNVHDDYAFRSIDDLVNSMSPVFAKHGVFYTPHVDEYVTSERERRSGGTQLLVLMTVTYTVYGPDGDYLTVTTVGQGLDVSDKSVNKAHTGALKTFLAQTFMVAFDLAEGDRTSPEGTAPDNADLLARLDAYARDQGIDRETITAKWRERNGNMPVDALATMHPDRLYPLVRSIGDYIEKQKAEAAEAARREADQQQQAAEQPQAP